MRLAGVLYSLALLVVCTASMVLAEDSSPSPSPLFQQSLQQSIEKFQDRDRSGGGLQNVNPAKTTEQIGSIVAINEKYSGPPIIAESAATPLGDVCLMQRDADDGVSLHSSLSAGQGFAAYYDPEDPAYGCGAFDPYSLEIHGIYVSFHGWGEFPVGVRLSIYEADLTDPQCPAAGQELCTTGDILLDEATYVHPNVGHVSLPGLCCVEGPFFVGLRYTGESPEHIPSVVMDASDGGPAPSCEARFYSTYSNDWVPWNGVFAPPRPGFPWLRVDAEIPPNGCEEPTMPGQATCAGTPTCPGEATCPPDPQCCYCGIPGDVDVADELVTPLDVSFLVNRVYKSMDALYDYYGLHGCPFENGDVDGSGGAPSPLDVALMVNMVYKSLDALCVDRCSGTPGSCPGP